MVGCASGGSSWAAHVSLTLDERSSVPTVLRKGPYRFYFYSHDRAEPAHVHVDRDDSTAKLWLDPPAVAFNLGFPSPELRRILRLVERHRGTLLESWREHFGT